MAIDDDYYDCPQGTWASYKGEPIKEKKMSKKYYRVLKDTPAWKQGAIVELDDNEYKAINDLWDNVENLKETYYETVQIVENSPEFFERVYAMGKAQKMLFVTKEKAQEMASKYFTGE